MRRCRRQGQVFPTAWAAATADLRRDQEAQGKVAFNSSTARIWRQARASTFWILYRLCPESFVFSAVELAGLCPIGWVLTPRVVRIDKSWASERPAALLPSELWGKCNE